MSGLISKIYMYLIRGQMNKAIERMQNDPELKRLKQKVDDAKTKFHDVAMKDEKFQAFILKTIKNKIVKKESDNKSQIPHLKDPAIETLPPADIVDEGGNEIYHNPKYTDHEKCVLSIVAKSRKKVEKKLYDSGYEDKDIDVVLNDILSKRVSKFVIIPELMLFEKAKAKLDSITITTAKEEIKNQYCSNCGSKF